MYKQPYVKLAITIKLDGREKTCTPRAFRVHSEEGRRCAMARRHVALGSSQTTLLSNWLSLTGALDKVQYNEKRFENSSRGMQMKMLLFFYENVVHAP